MDNFTNQGQLSPWFLKLPWICRQFGALIVAVMMITLWALLLIFHVSWWVILLTIFIPVIPLAIWLCYLSVQPAVIPAAQHTTNSASIRIADIDV